MQAYGKPKRAVRSGGFLFTYYKPYVAIQVETMNDGLLGV